MEDDRYRQLESAGRALAWALAQTDQITAAALLRCAAKYLEGSADGGADAPPVRPHAVGGPTRVSS